MILLNKKEEENGLQVTRITEKGRYSVVFKCKINDFCFCVKQLKTKYEELKTEEKKEEKTCLEREIKNMDILKGKDGFLLHLVREREPQMDGALPGVRRVEYDEGSPRGGEEGRRVGRKPHRRRPAGPPAAAPARDRRLAGGPHLPRHGGGGPHPRRRHGAGFAGAHRRRTGHREIHAQPADPAVQQGLAHALRDGRGKRPPGWDARPAPRRRRRQLFHLLRDAD